MSAEDNNITWLFRGITTRAYVIGDFPLLPASLKSSAARWVPKCFLDKYYFVAILVIDQNTLWVDYQP